MGKPLWRLTVRAEFAAAHALRHYQGKCEAMHGHNFQVEATVEGEALLPDTEMLADFSDLKHELASVLEELDHGDLCRVPPFDRINPSSENLARYLFQRLLPRMGLRGLRLHAVTVAERATQSATYMERTEDP